MTGRGSVEKWNYLVERDTACSRPLIYDTILVERKSVATVYLPYIRKLCTESFPAPSWGSHDIVDFVSLFQPLGRSPSWTGQRFVGSEPAEISVTR